MQVPENGWWRSRNLLLSLMLHSPGLLIQGKALNHDCVPSVEPAKIPSPETESQGAAAVGFQHKQTHKLPVSTCICVHGHMHRGHFYLISICGDWSQVKCER